MSSPDAGKDIAVTRSRLLVLASTYPRWRGDYEPGFVHELCRRLVTYFEVHVVCPHAPGALGEEILDGVTVHRFRYGPESLETLVQGGGILSNLKHHPWKWLLVPGFLLGALLGATRGVLKLEPRCIHAHWLIPQGLAAAAMGLLIPKMPPFLVTSHGGDLFGLRGRLFACMKRWVLGQAAAVTVVSRPMVEETLKLGVDTGNVRVIPMGVDFAGRFAMHEEPTRVPGEILFVGRLVEKKGLRYLIAAMPAILNRVPEARLMVVGGGPEELTLREQVAELGLEHAVRFLGPLGQEELPSLYRRASVFVAPFVNAASGDREGLGLVTVEAIACGCPVVVGDVPVVSDLFLESETEMRAQPGNTDDIAAKVAAVLEDRGAAVLRTLAVRERLAARLSWDSIAARYAETLMGLAIR